MYLHSAKNNARYKRFTYKHYDESQKYEIVIDFKLIFATFITAINSKSARVYGNSNGRNTTWWK